MTKVMQVAQGSFKLNRYPLNKKESLRAWDAADEYLLNYCNENFTAEKSLKILIVNDSFGALTLPLSAGHDVSLWSDSCLTEKGVSENFIANSADHSRYTFVKSTDLAVATFDLVLLKVPKSHAFLEHQLYTLLSVINENSRIISAGMSKNIHSSTLEYFESIIGETKTSLAYKKARLIFTATQRLDLTKKTPYPKTYRFDGFDYRITNHANVFSREKLDIGTRFFLEHIPAAEKYKSIVDLGCGNGLIGLAAAEKNPQASLDFADESFMAVASAKKNFSASSLANHSRFYAMDCLYELAEDSADLVLNNPPFHQQHATGDAVAWRMFIDAKRVLRKGGELWVIGNRHLSYQSKLKKLFKHCELIAANKKFVILKSVKSD
ncbi:MAG: methyltransferase [Gammaproteobacteria bacterium]|nr:methyltransferase [Gammaproteobacteria bacterium]